MTLRGAYRWGQAAFVVAIVAMVFSTWYLPALIRVLNKLSDQVEKQYVARPR